MGAISTGKGTERAINKAEIGCGGVGGEVAARSEPEGEGFDECGGDGVGRGSLGDPAVGKELLYFGDTEVELSGGGGFTACAFLGCCLPEGLDH